MMDTARDAQLGGEDAGRARVAVVVVSHETRRHALACLSTLSAAGADAVVLVDSGSRDGTASAVRRAHPSVAVLALPNVGFGRAANAGIARTDADVVVVANADTHFAAGSLEVLAGCFVADPGLGAVGPRVRYPDGRPQASARGLPGPRTALAHAVLGLWWPANPWTRAYRMADADPDEARDVDWLSGCALALRRAAIESVAGFDRGYFMYAEDLDLGWRLRQAGWRLRYEPAAEVVHSVGAATGQRGTQMLRAHARSLDRFYGRVYTRPAARALRPLVRLGLVGWVLTGGIWQRAVGRRRGRPSTGE